MRYFPYLCGVKEGVKSTTHNGLANQEVAHDTDEVQENMIPKIKLKKNETTLVDEIVTAEQIPADVLDMVRKIHNSTLTIYRQD